MSVIAAHRGCFHFTNFPSLKFFDFHTSKLEHTVTLPSSVVSIHLQRDSGLLAVICDDLVVRVMDLETRRIVRELGGFKGRLLDLVGGSYLVPRFMT